MMAKAFRLFHTLWDDVYDLINHYHYGLARARDLQTDEYCGIDLATELERMARDKFVRTFGSLANLDLDMCIAYDSAPDFRVSFTLECRVGGRRCVNASIAYLPLYIKLTN